MKCLIIAAGFGSRLRALSEAKPLAQLAGRPLIEHVVRRAMAGGATSFAVVTGHAADAVESFLASLSERLAVAIETVRVADWSVPNGHSVAAAAPLIGDERFILLMADHLFDPAILERLIRSDPRAGVTLAVDTRLDNPLVDLDDVTKVQVAADGSILRIGKTIDSYNAYDTGLFVASPLLFEALRRSIAAGAASLSEGVTRLAAEGEARTFDIGDGWWIDVDDARAHALCEAALAAQQTAPGRSA